MYRGVAENSFMDKKNLLSNHHEHNTYIKTVVVIAAVISLLLIGLAVWNSHQSNLKSSYNINQSIHLNQLSNELRYYDEVLTMSAFLSVTSGDLAWEGRYNKFAKKLDDTIASATNSATREVLVKLTDIHNGLMEIEVKFFNLIRHKHRDEALLLITSEKYQRLKNDYAMYLDELGSILQEQAQNFINENHLRQNQTTIGLVISMVLLVVIWCYVISTIRRWRLQILRYNEELSQLAHFDPLTGAVNRTLFNINLATAISYSRRQQKHCALLLLDLDNFKIVNDTLGHPVGDKLLISIAEKLKDSCREIDTVARLGGDEFAVIITDLEKKDYASLVAEKLLSACRTPIEIDGQKMDTFASMGIAIYPDHGGNEEELLQKADIALYKAKDSGRNTVAVFDQEMEMSVRNR